MKKKLKDYMSDTFKVFGHFHVIKQNVKAYAVHMPDSSNEQKVKLHVQVQGLNSLQGREFMSII